MTGRRIRSGGPPWRTTAPGRRCRRPFCCSTTATTVAEARGSAWLARPAGLDDVALFGGVIIYLTALLALEWRAVRRARPAPVVALVALVVGAVAVGGLPATISLALLALICVALVLGGMRSGDPLRRQVRQTALEEQVAAEHDQSEWRRRNL
ncbi:low temperature requirement protein A [Micromonospora rubida]|uniref:low temperature requirement protein A n=1 Tax=Micromonospora rubida TaxID=2697657 RepID=UPI001377C9FC|nr:low temperature requirement protein A [Micromonospora rubida]NBE84081.1 hypothetical protein [Micromonospora rubida]